MIQHLLKNCGNSYYGAFHGSFRSHDSSHDLGATIGATMLNDAIEFAIIQQ